MRPVIETQFSPSAVQMVGRLFGIVTTAPAAATGALDRMAALALATLTLALALASSALALAFARPRCWPRSGFCSLSSFCSIKRNCCLSSAISASLLPADCAWACEANSAPIRPIAVATPDFVLDMRASPFTLDFIRRLARRTGVSDCSESPWCNWKNSGDGADVGSSRRVDDAGINLCPLGNAAIASRPQRQENSRML